VVVMLYTCITNFMLSRSPPPPRHITGNAAGHSRECCGWICAGANSRSQPGRILLHDG
jgi:hypothetical protein